jgi:hypothetical protein
MKYFLISYTFSEGSEEAWHQEVHAFIAALENDPEIGGNVSYTCLKSTKGPQYYHLAIPADEDTTKQLGKKDFFKHYTQETERVSGGTVTVTPLELVAGTSF